MKRILQIGLLLAGLAWCVSAHASVTCAQGGVGCTVTTTRTGTTTGTSVNITVTATHAGALLIMCVNMNSSSTTATAPTTDGTWTVSAASLGTNGSSSRSECEYNLNATGGVTTETCTVSGSVLFDCEFFEFTNSIGNGWTFDNPQGGSDAACTTCAGVAFTLATSNNYALAQSMWTTVGNVSAINQSYNIALNATTGSASAYKIATVAGTTPNWTVSSSGTGSKSGISIYETPASGSTFRTQVGAFSVGP